MVDSTSFPYSTFVRIITTINGNQYQGSGVMISPDEVLTAAHVVWQTGAGLATNVQVTPGYSAGLAPFGTFSGTVTHYNAIDDTDDVIDESQIPNDFAVVHLSSPTGAGSLPLDADYSGGIATVSGYPGGNGGMRYDVAETVETSTLYNVLTGGGIGLGSSGGPVWTVAPNGPIVEGLVSAGDTVGDGYFTKITAAVRGTINGWVAQDDAPPSPPSPPVAGYIDNDSGQQGTVALTAASGGPSYLQWQYIWSSTDGVSLSTSAPNVFLHGGSGQDSLQVTSGQNVLDGGTGSNFLTGGSGADTFFTDARGSAPVWNTLRNFHAGDSATLWGFVPGVSSYYWDDHIDGAPGSTGATLRANIVGGAGRAGDGIDASITFAGLSVAQAKTLQVSVGTQQAGSYLYFGYAA